MNDPVTLSQAIADFHFLRPLWLLALLPALFFVTRLWKLNAQGSAWTRVIDRNLLPFLLNASKNGAERTPLFLLLAAWILAVTALAGPTWSKQTQPVQQRQDALVIVLDLSLGMLATDFDPNRVTVARRKILDILDLRREGQTALVVYAGEAHMVTPLTNDTVSIRAMVPALRPGIMPVVGNNPGHAIELARQLMDDASTIRGRILLLTAGVPQEQNPRLTEALAGSPYPLDIIGIGSERGAPIQGPNGEYLRDSNGQVVVSSMDRGNLQNLASNLRGRYRDLSVDDDDLRYVMAETLSRGSDDTYLETEEEVELWSDAGPWLLLMLLPLCALCFRRGWVLQLAISSYGLWLVLAPGQAEAVDLRSLWLNKNQRAAKALEEGDPVTAASLFEDTAWQATASYRAGDYASAIRHFSAGDDTTSLYNLGNSLAFAERLEEAIAAYDAVLAQDPDHEDALHNKAIVEELLQEQQQQQQEEQEQQEQEQESQDTQSESDSDSQQQQEQQQQQQQEPQEQEAQEQDSETQEEQQESNDSQNSQRSENTEFEENQESLEQFLRRIEDDPGELLQRKFQFESRRRMIERRTASRESR